MPADNSTKRLFLLDAYALIYRAYFAFIRNPRINSKGMNTSAVFGFTSALNDIIQTEDPTHLAVVFDPPGPNFRHEKYPEYKAHRDATPEDIRQSIPIIKKIIKAFNIPVVEVAGFEADDVIGTLAKIAEKKDFDVYMVTPDKDFAQLVSERIFMYKPGKRGSGPEIWKEKEIKENFHVEHPDQVRDILALWGDAADNIPGAPGIGEVISKRLIQEFGSIENLFKNTGRLKGKQRENIENNTEQILLSKDLVTIHREVPVSFDEKELERKPINIPELTRLFDDLEFRTLTRRIMGRKENNNAVQGSLFEQDDGSGQTPIIKNFKTSGTVPHNYKLIRNKNERKQLITELLRQREFCFDTETTGLNVLDDEIVGLAFSFESHTAYYVALPENRFETETILNEFKEIFQNEAILKIGQNIKYDIHILNNYNIQVKGPLFDTMVAHYLVQPDQRHNLNHLAGVYLNYSTISIEQLIGEKGKQQTSMRLVPLEKITEYAGEDADITYQLSLILKEELAGNHLTGLFEKIEMPLVPVLVSMERAGVKVDVNALNEFAVILRGEIESLEKQVIDLAGTAFNLSSPKQLGTILFEKMNIVSNAKKTKTKQYSTSEDVLMRLKDKHPIIPRILEYRSLKKLLSTYVEVLPGLIRPDSEKIHTSFKQTIAATGRLSSVNPNLQNIPIRGERGREIRKAFIPSGRDYRLLSADYSQIELRLMAHMSEDPSLCKAFINDEDIHKATAAKIYNVQPDAVTREMRAHAKVANFGIIYGISSFGLSQRLYIPRHEASQLIEGYFHSYPGVRKYMDASIQMARDKGYVETVFGRKRHLKDIHSRNAVVRGMAERNAINAPIQGSAADIIKLAMRNIQDRLTANNMQTKMILQVHDELVFDVFIPEMETIKKLVIEEMESVYQLKVPLKADYGAGKNWLEAHD